MRPFANLLIILSIVLISLLSMGTGVHLAGKQHRQLHDYKQVEGTLLTESLMRVSWGKTLWLVKYEYQQVGQDYVGYRTAPLPRWTRHQTAERLADAFQINQAVMIAVDPDDPKKSYLVTERAGQFYPYALILLGVGMGLLLLLPLQSGGMFERKPMRFAQDDYDWYHLRESKPLQKALIINVVILAAWIFLGLLTMIHYLGSVKPAHFDFFVVFAGVYAIAGVLPLLKVIRLFKRQAAAGESQVMTTLPTLRLRESLIARVEHRFDRQVAVNEARAMLICVVRNGLTTRQVFHTSQTILSNHIVKAGELIFDDCTFTVPRNKQRPSSVFRRFTFPRVEWFIRLRIDLEDGTRYRADFPIEEDSVAQSQENPVKENLPVGNNSPIHEVLQGQPELVHVSG